MQTVARLLLTQVDIVKLRKHVAVRGVPAAGVGVTPAGKEDCVRIVFIDASSIRACVH